MDAPIERIKQELRDQDDLLGARISQSEAVLADLQEQRRCIAAALLGLDGGSSKAKPEKARKGGLTQPQTATVVAKILKDGPIAEDDLRQRTRTWLKEVDGANLRGFKQRFDEVMRLPELGRTTDGLIALAKGGGVTGAA